MNKKSKTQMTKAELIELCYELEKDIANKQKTIDSLQNDRVALDTIVADTDVSAIITGMSARIKKLEERLDENGYLSICLRLTKNWRNHSRIRWNARCRDCG